MMMIHCVRSADVAVKGFRTMMGKSLGTKVGRVPM